MIYGDLMSKESYVIYKLIEVIDNSILKLESRSILDKDKIYKL